MYRSARLPVRGPFATGRYRQNRPSAVACGRKREEEEEEKKKEEDEEKKNTSCCPRPYAVAARGSPARSRRPRAIFLPRREKDGDVTLFLSF
ncbi:hypothetical protein GW17_00001217 [Ensete ventricosum]|nr:hypothetical protein GW17_00001217 [Ensete ventricosum]